MTTPGGLSWQGGWDEPGVLSYVLINAEAGGGLFVYSGTPTAGNLVASITAPAAGQYLDPFGNMVIPDGFVTYNEYSPGVWIAVQYADNGIKVWGATSYAGPYSSSGIALLFSNAGVLGMFAFNDGSGNAYSVGHQVLIASATTINKTTPIEITGLATNVAIGNYLLTGSLRCVSASSGTTQAFRMQFNGTCTVSGMRIKTKSYLEEASAPINTGVISALATDQSPDTGAIANNTVFDLDFEGVVEVSGGGTFIAYAHQATSSSDETFTVQALSWMNLVPQ